MTEIETELERVKADPRLKIPLDGPGSHRQDLAQLRLVQEELERVKDHRDILTKEIERSRFALTNQIEGVRGMLAAERVAHANTREELAAALEDLGFWNERALTLRQEHNAERAAHETTREELDAATFSARQLGSRNYELRDELEARCAAWETEAERLMVECLCAYPFEVKEWRENVEKGIGAAGQDPVATAAANAPVSTDPEDYALARDWEQRIRRDERERCAKVAESVAWYEDDPAGYARQVARAIRALGDS